ncbi:MAG: asparagine synthase (glutamine-hydrolyzing) [Gammaproteobacteria bacterium]
MCGLAGIVSWRHPLETSFLKEFDKRLKHRGPDGRGFLSWDGVHTYTSDSPENLPKGRLLLAHRRLAIQDLSPNGAQPMRSQDGRYHLVFNGEIYNFLELKQQLEQEGYTFQSESDTEVLLNALLAWGKKAIHQLNGTFCFVLFDSIKQTLLLCRDHVGVKPLYYYQTANLFSFASEIKALLPLVPSPIADLQATYEFILYGQSDFPDKTFYEHIKPFPAGSWLEIDLQKSQVPRPERFWNLNLDKISNCTFEEATEEFKFHFLESLRLQTRSQAAISLTLSGGLDSSSIFCGLKHLRYPEPQTFSYIAEEESVSELVWIQALQPKLNTSVRLSSEEILEIVNQVLDTQDQPFGSPSIIAQYKLYECIHSAGCKVNLSGQGADELFGGYAKYLATRFKHIRRASLFKGLQFLFNTIRHNDLLKKPHIQSILSAFKTDSFGSHWIENKWFQDRGIKQPVSVSDHDSDNFRRQRYLDLTERLLPSLLRFEDHNAMAHSVENRVPFLSPKLIEWVFQLPDEFIINDQGIRKVLLRNAMQGIVPNEILSRRDKIGFLVKCSTKQSSLHQTLNLPYLKRKKLSNYTQKQISNNKFLWRLWSLQLIRSYC